ncbi:Eukaryotic translation initiation factor 5A [Plasmodiophora brassicae]|uniref:Eukaryotic translation initiation factor 5A n=2 Tax=Plasmodiophora brassicae TaxID=37360 RepID=A0A3P3YB54_PLABS|nr:unnamed protein product [Plasmodiophora brassicae]
MADESSENASKMTPIKAGSLKKGGYLQIKGHPCKIMSMSTSKTGKHGHAKMNIVGVDVLTSKKYEDMTPTSHTVMVPIVTKTEFQVIDIADGYVHIMDEDGTPIEDVKLPEDELGTQIQEAFEAGDKDVLVTVLQAPEGEDANQANWVRMIVSFKTVGQ